MRRTIFLTTLCFIIGMLVFNSCSKNNTSNKTTSACIFTDSMRYANWNSCYLFFPNIFSPNNDGINDIFIPLHTDSITNYSLVIKDGPTILFSTTNDTVGWDGTSNSVMMPAGKYHAEVTVSMCGQTINWNSCIYLAEYNSSNCIPKPNTTTPLVFGNQVDPITNVPVYPSNETFCP